MKIYYGILAVLLVMAGCAKPETPNGFIDADIFLNPPIEYRSAPFYSLNDKLDTAEVIRQVRGFKEAGFGGSFLHSRGGLLTEYMGSEWWEVMDAAVRTSKEIGINAWFYDEDKWPSGFAGGKIPLVSEDFHARCLTRVEKDEEVDEIDSVLYEDDRYRYIIHKARMGNGWFNGTCYTDLLNSDMVKTFIDSAYAPYLERYRAKIGKTVPGIFTDEPQVSARVSGGKEGSVSFSPVVIDKFKEMHGYDLLPVIPMLFDTIGNYSKVRYDYYQTISRCFEESFARQIGAYCEEMNTIFTGHLNGENTFETTMANSGNSMINYRHMQMPGIDQLGLYYPELNIPRSVSSVANQYGIARRMSESYGISGHNMNFEDRKWLLDWLTINGINFIVPHLTSYSMKGERKRDYPPNFSPAQPYWEYNSLFEDYSARICYVNTIGKYAANLLLIHPLESEYLGIRNNSFNIYSQCMTQLLKSHRNFDLGDEQILSEIAKVENGELVVGEMAYRLLILPGMLVVRSSTLDLLERFHASGGKILVYGYYPGYVDGESNPDAVESLKRISRLVSEDEFVDLLDGLLPAEYALKGVDSENVWTHFRKVDNGGILQLSNTSRLKEVECNLQFAGPVTNPVLWNPEDGASMKLTPGGDGEIKLRFAATQSWIVTFGEASKDADLSVEYRIGGEKTELIRIQNAWEGKRLDPNALTLDFARYSTDNGNSFSDPEPVIGIHRRLTKERYNGSLILQFEPQVADIPENCSLVVEQSHLYNIAVNGKEIRFEGDSYYRDHALRVQDISGTLRRGKNEITLTVNYTAPETGSLNAVKRYGTEIESIYLVGDFGVTAVPSSLPVGRSHKYRDKTLVEKPVYRMERFEISSERSLFDNDLVLQGYPFYAGRFILSNRFNVEKIDPSKRYLLSFPAFESTAVIVRLNGEEFEPMIFSPWEVDITGAIREEENRIEVELVNSLRNLMGPHHHRDGELKKVGPASFTGKAEWPNEGGGEDNWYDLRLKGKATLWRDDYCHIPFGLLGPVVISSIAVL
jgi:hypothetical protein